MKKLAVLLTILMIFSVVSAYASTNKPLENLGSGLNDVVYGNTEIPDDINATKTKGTPAYEKCTQKTNDDVGRGLAKFVGGLWKVATFWYPESDASCQTQAVPVKK